MKNQVSSLGENYHISSIMKSNLFKMFLYKVQNFRILGVYKYAYLIATYYT